MKPLISIVSSIGLSLALFAAPAQAQGRRAPDGDSGGSEPRTASGGGSDSDAGSRPEPVSRAPVGRVDVPRAQPRPASAPAATAASKRVAAPTDRTGQRFAVARPAGDFDRRPIRVIWDPVHFPTVVGYGPWGYDPWGYGYGSHFGIRNYWHSPYSYGYWPGYGYSYGYWTPIYGSGYAGGAYGAADGRETEDAGQPMGSIRFRASPKHAAIYIDGALAGTVDDFDGLTDHLRLTAGPHAYELRAEGYQPYTGTLTVVAGQTRTERVELQRQPLDQ
jgi:hypothetical protein